MTLEQLRDQIDQIDRDLLVLIEKRMALVEQVIDYKRDKQVQVLDNGREQAVLDRIAGLVENPQYQKTAVAIFADIMKNSRRYQNEKLAHDR